MSASPGPDDGRDGLPMYPWRSGPLGLATRRQLRDRGLRPGSPPIAVEVMRRRRGDEVVARLYDVATARPDRTVVRGLLAVVARALESRRICPTCAEVRDYVIPRRNGECLDCAAPPPGPAAVA